MPFINGVKVTNEEWLVIKNDGQPAPTWKDAAGWQDGDDPQPEPVAVEEPVAKKRIGSKKKETEAALAAVTGQDITLGDDDLEDLAGVVDLDEDEE